jgi:hypothetical protein
VSLIERHLGNAERLEEMPEPAELDVVNSGSDPPA